MKIIFTRDTAFLSTLSRLVQGLRAGHFGLAPWAHCAIVTADGKHIIDAFARRSGVTKRSLNSFLEGFPDHQIVEASAPNEAEALTWLETQLYKDYDWRGLLGFIVGFDTADRNKWYCFRLGAEVARRAGLPATSDDRVDCYKLLKYMGAPVK
jgi:hypothetical protein